MKFKTVEELALYVHDYLNYDDTSCESLTERHEIYLLLGITAARLREKMGDLLDEMKRKKKKVDYDG